MLALGDMHNRSFLLGAGKYMCGVWVEKKAMQSEGDAV